MDREGKMTECLAGIRAKRTDKPEVYFDLLEANVGMTILSCGLDNPKAVMIGPQFSELADALGRKIVKVTISVLGEENRQDFEMDMLELFALLVDESFKGGILK